MANACEDYLDQLRRLRHLVLTDSSAENNARRLQAALDSLRECIQNVIAGIVGEMTVSKASQNVYRLTRRFQKEQGLEQIDPISRAGFAQLMTHLKDLPAQHKSASDRGVADMLLERIFGGLTQPHAAMTLTRYLRHESMIPVAPLATDAFLVSLLVGFHHRMGSCLASSMGVVVTDPYPGDGYFEGGSRCLISQNPPLKCVIMTDLNHKGITRAECIRIVHATYPDIEII